jgi:hypothetical protein
MDQYSHVIIIIIIIAAVVVIMTYHHAWPGMTNEDAHPIDPAASISSMPRYRSGPSPARRLNTSLSAIIHDDRPSGSLIVCPWSVAPAENAVASLCPPLEALSPYHLTFAGDQADQALRAGREEEDERARVLSERPPPPLPFCAIS